MPTLDDIATWTYSTMLSRTGDTSIQTMARDAAQNFYELLCDAVPFDELMFISSELALVAGQTRYTIGTSGMDWNLAQGLRSIASMRITYATNQSRRLRRSHARIYDAMSFVTRGRPATYARFGSAIELQPPPDSSAYTVRMRYWGRPTIVASPNEYTSTIILPKPWHELMKWETLYRTYYALGQIDRAMTLIQPAMLPMQPTPRKMRTDCIGIIPKLWNDLLKTTSQQENVDEDFSINPTIRRYSIA